MRRHGEAVPPADGRTQHERRAQRAELNILVVVLVGGGVLTSLPYTAVEHQSVQWKLAYGVATYVVALVAALLLKGVARLPSMRGLRVALGTALLVLVTFQTLFGSMVIAFAVVQLVGNRPGGPDVLLGLGLWALVVFPLLLLARRHATLG